MYRKMFVATILVVLLGLSFGSAQQNLNPAQLTAWQNFFDKTGGSKWSRCSGKRSNPCSCSGTANAIVTCNDVGGTLFISSILLRNNNLVGPNVPGTELDTIISNYADFTSLDLTNNPNLKNTKGGCIRIPSCSQEGVTCQLAFQICPADVTSSPSGGESTESPSSTDSPAATDSPSSTGSPSSTDAPATGSPTSATTNSPTTGSPATESPSSTEAPGTSTPTTQAPGTTKAPTAPTASGTKSPTGGVAPDTPSPTTSAATTVSSSKIVAAAGLVATLAFAF